MTAPVSLADQPVTAISPPELSIAIAAAPEAPEEPEPTVDTRVETDLLVALQRGDTESARIIMLTRPPVYERTTGRGESALMLAARYAPSMVGDLVAHGATINLRSDAGQTPLHFAVMGANDAAARELLEQGADPDQPDNSGLSARDLSRDADSAIRELFARY